MRALLLDSTYFPIKIISWKKALILHLNQRAEVLDVHKEKTIRGVKRTFKVPKTLKLFKRHKQTYFIKFNRENLFKRDNYQCQYCLTILPSKKLTLDHVYPKSKGGKTSWKNIVACCRPCNEKKGDKLLSQIDMKLNTHPRAPSWSPNIALSINDPEDIAMWKWWWPTSKKQVS